MKRLLLFACLLIVFVYMSCEKEVIDIGNDKITAALAQNALPVNFDTKFEENQTLASAFANFYVSPQAMEVIEVNGVSLPLYQHINAVILETARWGMHGYFFIPMDLLISKCAEKGIEILPVLNAMVTDDLPPNYNSLANMIFDNEGNTPYHLLIPYLDDMLGKSPNDDGTVTFYESDLLTLVSKKPWVGYDEDNESYPIRGFRIIGQSILHSPIIKTYASDNYGLYIANDFISECIIDGSLCHGVINQCYGLANAGLCEHCNPPDYSEIPEEAGGQIGSEELIINLKKL